MECSTQQRILITSIREGRRYCEESDVLLILESMKMMNEIRFDYDGIIMETGAKNEELVEFDQVMFVLEKGE